MRVSTGMIFTAGAGGIQKRTSDMLRTQQQLSSGKRIMAPSDDPVGAARALQLNQALNINSAQTATRTDAKSSLGLVDNQLGSVTDLLTRVKELAVQAGNAALSDTDKKSIATELRARYSELVGLANSTDGSGKYLFSGYQDSSRPFGGSIENGIQYVGDSGTRQLQVSASRQLGISAPGDDVFMKIRNGNGTFQATMQTAKTANAVNVKSSAAMVDTAADWNDPINSGKLEVRFMTDTAGTMATRGYALGGVDLAALITTAPPLDLTGNNSFNLTVDGVTQNITVATGPFNSPGEVQGAVRDAVDAVFLPAGSVNVALDGSSKLMITSGSTGTTSTVQVANDGVTGGFATLFGAPLSAAGAVGAKGRVFYDVVDSLTGNSLFANAASTAGGVGNTYTHVYNSGVPFSLSGFDKAAYTTASNASGFGATLTFSGVPASGDVFSVSRNSTGNLISVAEKKVAAWHAGATIDKGIVTNPTAWRQSANSGNLELRFWVDGAGGTTTQGQAVGSATPMPEGATAPTTPLVVTAGSNDQFNINLDGGGAVAVTIPPGNYTTAAALVTAMQTAVDTATGVPGGAQVALDASNHLVMTSANGALGSIALSAVASNTGLASLFGTPSTTAAGQSVGSSVPVAPVIMSPATPLTLTAANNQFLLSLDGAAAVNVTVPAATYNQVGTAATAGSFLNALQTAVDAATGAPGAAKVSIDAANHIVITSATSGSTSSVVLGATASNAGLATMFGTPTLAAGITSVPGTTFYDLVDATSGKSAFTGTASTTGGASNTYSHVYVPGQTISLSGAGGVGTPATSPFNFGAAVTMAGTPASGDTFTIKSSTSALGNGYFITGAKTAAAVNTGSSIMGSGEVQDLSKWNNPANSRNLEVRFWNDTSVTPSQMYYDLVDVSTEKSLFSNSISEAGGAGSTYTHKFSPGDTISFSGLNVPVAGPPASTVTDFGISVKVDSVPASGDVFAIKPSTTQNVFDTLANLVNALEDPKPIGTTGNNFIANKVGEALTNIDQAMDNVLRIRASVGSGLNELDSLDNVGANLDLQFRQTLSGIEDLDYSKSITDLMRQQTELQAAQQSFAKFSNLSLFNYL